MQEYLEKNYKEDMNEEDTFLLAISAVAEVVEAGKRNVECVIITKTNTEFVSPDKIAQDVIIIHRKQRHKCILNIHPRRHRERQRQTDGDRRRQREMEVEREAEREI